MDNEKIPENTSRNELEIIHTIPTEEIKSESISNIICSCGECLIDGYCPAA